MSALDENVGAILDALRSEGLEEDTLVLFTSDNGAPDETFNRGLLGGKWSTLEGGLRVPLLARWPGRIAPNSRSNTPAATFDILPTILAAIGLRDDGLRLDGRSFVRSLLSRPPPDDRVLFWEVLNRFAVRALGHKLFRSRGNKIFIDDEPTLLVELGRDLRETRDLSDARPRTAKRLRRSYASLRRDAMRIDFEIAQVTGRVRRHADTLCFGHAGGVARIDHDSRFDVSDGEFSISLWVRPGRIDADGARVLVAKDGAWRLALTPDHRISVQLTRKSIFPLTLVSRRPIASDGWTHVGLTIDRRRFGKDTFLDVDLWIDGTPDRGTRVTALAPVAINDADLSFGNALDGRSPFFGALHEIRFYNADLDADEMAAIAAGPRTPGSCERGRVAAGK